MPARPRATAVPPTPVHAALGVVLAAAVLGTAFDRRAALLAPLAGAAPDLDALIGLLGGPTGPLPIPENTHAVVLHTLLVPLLVAVLLAVDARRERPAIRPWLEQRAGPGAMALAWTAVLVYAVAGIGLDLLNVATANVLWPVHDQFYAMVGKVEFSNTVLFEQTFVQFGVDGHAVYVGQQGSTARFFVPSAVNPTYGSDAGAERVVNIVDSGWQLLAVLAAPALAYAALRTGTDTPTGAGVGDTGPGTATTEADADAAPTSAPEPREATEPTED
jgi:hypothetical protein